MPEREIARRDEPTLDMKNIQGNVVAGFKKPFQTLLYYRINDDGAARFKGAIRALADHVATARDVHDHNREVNRARDEGSTPPTQTWMNLAFSCAGLRRLTSDADRFADAAFRDGMVERSHLLGDPDPAGWKIRDDTAHLLLIVAADHPTDVADKVAIVRSLILEHGGATELEPDKGFVLREPPDTGDAREHFGYRDGVSQPGLRGRASEAAEDWITPPENPANPNHGKPGQELVWPGEFVFGYPDQDGRFVSGEVDWMTAGDGFPLAPKWARDGSYLVFRRLRQHVDRFHQAVQSDRDGARIVGRWLSGTPLLKAPEADRPHLADDEDFEFVLGEVNVCPGNAHIRKVNPRTEFDDLERPKHRLLRRGITFGKKSTSTPAAPQDDGIERGLLFLAYMTSITYQFEFVMNAWSNHPDFRSQGVGADALLGPDWIEPTGGGYYFAPSLSALRNELSA